MAGRSNQMSEAWAAGSRVKGNSPRMEEEEDASRGHMYMIQREKKILKDLDAASCEIFTATMFQLKP